MLLRTPTKLTLTLVYLFLLTACGGAAAQPAARIEVVGKEILGAEWRRVEVSVFI